MEAGNEAAANGVGLTPELVFTIASNMVLPGWLLLIFLPRWKVTGWVVHAGLLPAMLGGMYVWIILPSIMQGAMNFSDFGSLAGVMRLFSQPWAVVVGWIHYLAFDLWVGAWETRDGDKVGLPHLLVVPCLVLTFLLGPVGLLAYLFLRWTVARRFVMDWA